MSFTNDEQDLIYTSILIYVALLHGKPPYQKAQKLSEKVFAKLEASATEEERSPSNAKEKQRDP